ncbi:MAG: hypothetical protein RI842_00315 [Schleiferiaceae bacterium]|nr:hypothetical protein [Schleiferiaceae bacterium]
MRMLEALGAPFQAEDIIAVDRREGQKQSVFHRLNAHTLKAWWQDQSLGDLWEPSVIESGQATP